MELPKSLDWILDKIVKSEGCWEWVGSLSKDGYGRVTSAKHTGKTVKVSRLIYQTLHGALLPGEVVRHTCDNRGCVKPQHLVKGTPRDNVQDMISRGRGIVGCKNPRTHLTDEDIIKIREDTRPRKEIAKGYNISKSQVSHIKRHDSWKHLGGEREYHGPSLKLTPEDVINIRGDTRKLRIISEEYGVSISTISRIQNFIRQGKL